MGNKETENALLTLLRQNKITVWRRHLPLPGKPDFAFPKHKVAVFVDGCFWHGCPKCYTRPKTDRAFWDRKREDNMARARHVTRQLRGRGCKVIRIWQLPSAVYAALRYLLVAKATYLRLRLRFSTPFPE
jgi:DNA mismatch endonuclease, patch repair protein